MVIFAKQSLRDAFEHLIVFGEKMCNREVHNLARKTLETHEKKLKFHTNSDVTNGPSGGKKSKPLTDPSIRFPQTHPCMGSRQSTF